MCLSLKIPLFLSIAYLGYRCYKLRSTNFLYRLALTASYNVIYLYSYFQICYNKLLSHPFVKEHILKKNIPVGSKHLLSKVQYIKDGYITHNILFYFDNMMRHLVYEGPCEQPFVDIYEESEIKHIKSDSNYIESIEKSFPFDLRLVVVFKNNYLIVPPKENNIPKFIENAVDKFKNMSTTKFILVELIVRDRTFIIDFKNENFNFYITGNEISLDFMKYFLKYGVDDYEVNRDEIVKLMDEHTILTIIDDDVNIKEIKLGLGETLIFTENSYVITTPNSSENTVEGVDEGVDKEVNKEVGEGEEDLNEQFEKNSKQSEFEII